MAEQNGAGGSKGDAPLSWGSGQEMNAFETVMWRAEADRSLRSPIVALEQLDTVPGWDRFLAAHEWAVRMVPRFRQRVVDPRSGSVPRAGPPIPSSTCASTCAARACPRAAAGPACWMRPPSSR